MEVGFTFTNINHQWSKSMSNQSYNGYSDHQINQAIEELFPKGTKSLGFGHNDPGFKKAQAYFYLMENNVEPEGQLSKQKNSVKPIKVENKIDDQSWFMPGHQYHGNGGVYSPFRNALKPTEGSTYGNILPYERDVAGNLSWGMPNMMRSALESGGELIGMSGAAMRGELDMNNPAVSRNVMAGIVDFGIGGGMASHLFSRPRGSAAMNHSTRLADGGATMYNAPIKPQRAFEKDYPNGGLTDDRGQLLTDIDGRPLTAPIIAGRTRFGGIDTGVSPKVYDTIGKGLMGQRARRVPQESLGPESVGATYVNPVTRKPVGIDISSALVNQNIFNGTYRHELGHAIDQMAGEIPIGNVETGLRKIYHDINTGDEFSNQWRGPEAYGYDAENIPRELMAEAINAYMENPNYVKTVAPDVAKHIRKHVNNNPNINRVIQFNQSGKGAEQLGLGVKGVNACGLPPASETTLKDDLNFFERMQKKLLSRPYQAGDVI